MVADSVNHPLSEQAGHPQAKGGAGKIIENYFPEFASYRPPQDANGMLVYVVVDKLLFPVVLNTILP